MTLLGPFTYEPNVILGSLKSCPYNWEVNTSIKGKEGQGGRGSQREEEKILQRGECEGYDAPRTTRGECEGYDAPRTQSETFQAATM